MRKYLLHSAAIAALLSVNADYLHVDCSSAAGISTANNVSSFGHVFTHFSEIKADLFRAGLNYRFGAPEPASGGGAKAPGQDAGCAVHLPDLATGNRGAALAEHREYRSFGRPKFGISARATEAAIST